MAIDASLADGFAQHRAKSRAMGGAPGESVSDEVDAGDALSYRSIKAAVHFAGSGVVFVW